ncbi:hypothetical protein [Butyricimonas synergistica]|uniref:hypothetical protein n=1 Tax=Butyricimonas synergistica TaxID=544644 RepID=UPI0003651488|nr:hypothetical protein [Butyricimonas synergistica]
MKILKYIIGIGLIALLFGGCDDVDDMPPRIDDIRTTFILPAQSRLTNAERDIVQARIDAYKEAIGN